MRILLIQVSDEPFNAMAPHRFKDYTEPFHICIKMTGVNRDDDGNLINDAKSNEIQTIMDWCLKSFGDQCACWATGYTWLFLRRESDLMRFKLRWC